MKTQSTKKPWRLYMLVASMIALVLTILPGSTALAQDPDPIDSTTIPADPPLPADYTPDGPAIEAVTPVIRVYKDNDGWGDRDGATLLALGKTLGVDWFIHPTSACASGIPAGTSVVLFTSNAYGLVSSAVNETSAACQTSLNNFLNGGGVLIVDMGDNLGPGGYIAPGATGTPALVFPTPCPDATLASYAKGLDGILGTADDHPIVKGPDGIAGTGDDLNDMNIDHVMACYVAHGNLTNGITLPPTAKTLMTALFVTPQPVLAEYCVGSGRVILDTLTKEFVGFQPFGGGPSYFLSSLLSYALSPAAGCNQPPTVGADNLTVTVNEGQTAANTGTYSDANAGDLVTISASVGTVTMSGTNSGTWSWSLGTTDGPAQSQTVTITANDGNGGIATTTFALTVNNVAPTLTSVAGSLVPIPLNTNTSITLAFNDPAAVLDTSYLVEVDWDDGAGFVGSGTIPYGGGSINHTYPAAGVYLVCARVTDKDLGVSNKQCADYVIVYDPSAGFITGGGWINSLAGSYAADLALAGKANFGFVSKYKKGATIPVGETEFNFHVASFNFHSDTYQWLVVSGCKAQYKGAGSVNGVSGYGFLLTATDGDICSVKTADKFRIKIWRLSDSIVVYDNKMGSSTDIDSANPQNIDGGQIVIHK